MWKVSITITFYNGHFIFELFPPPKCDAHYCTILKEPHVERRKGKAEALAVKTSHSVCLVFVFLVLSECVNTEYCSCSCCGGDTRSVTFQGRYSLTPCDNFQHQSSCSPQSSLHCLPEGVSGLVQKPCPWLTPSATSSCLIRLRKELQRRQFRTGSVLRWKFKSTQALIRFLFELTCSLYYRSNPKDQALVVVHSIISKQRTFRDESAQTTVTNILHYLSEFLSAISGVLIVVLSLESFIIQTSLCRGNHSYGEEYNVESKLRQTRSGVP